MEQSDEVSSQNKWFCEIRAFTNTWSHQRRKRRLARMKEQQQQQSDVTTNQTTASQDVNKLSNGEKSLEKLEFVAKKRKLESDNCAKNNNQEEVVETKRQKLENKSGNTKDVSCEKEHLNGKDDLGFSS